MKKYKKIIGKKLPDYITNELKWWNEKIENCIPNDNRIVVIKEKKELCLLLLSLEKKVIFCGKIPFFFKILLRARRIRYGEEPVWPRVLKNINCDLEIPFVFVNGDINDSMKAAFYLQKRLRNDGFACAVVSCVKYSYLSGVFYFSNYKMITNESVKRISRLLNLDIVIIVGKCNMPQNEDIKILFDEQKNMYVIDNTNRVRFVHSLDEIYSNIIDFYS